MALKTKEVAASSRIFAFAERTRDAIKIQDLEGNKAAIVRSDAEHVEELANEVIKALMGPDPGELVTMGETMPIELTGHWSVEVQDAKGRGSVTVLRRGRKIDDNEWVIMPLEANVNRLVAAIGVIADEGCDGNTFVQQTGDGGKPVQRRTKDRAKPWSKGKGKVRPKGRPRGPGLR
jgi:hypothetical protein